MKKYIYGHTSPDTAHVVSDYPWGFRLRTTIRYWIETSTAKNGGQRFCRQTIDPRSGRWCAPKKGTYRSIAVMFLDEEDHVGFAALSMNDDGEAIASFKENHLDSLDEYQKSVLKKIIATEKVMKKVTWSVTKSCVEPIDMGKLLAKDPIEMEKSDRLIKEQEENKRKQLKIIEQINRAINCEIKKVVL